MQVHRSAPALAFADLTPTTVDPALDDGFVERQADLAGTRVFRFRTDPFNWYVIEEAGRLTLVDAGFPGHFDAFLRGLSAVGRSIGDVEAIVLTHAHADHMGFIEKLRRRTDVPVFVHEGDRAAAGRPLQLPWWTLLSNAWRPFTAGMLTHATLNGIFTMPAIRHCHPVVDGTALDIPGRPQVIHLPGHTPGQIGLLLEGARVLLAGDALVTRHLLRGDYGAPQLVANGLNDDALVAARSLARLRDLGRLTLLTGHGKGWTGEMEEAVAGALDEFERRSR